MLKKIGELFCITVLVITSQGCGKIFQNGEVIARKVAPKPLSEVVTVTAFADREGVARSTMSTTQNDTVCVNLTGFDLAALKVKLDAEAELFKTAQPEVYKWYWQYVLNDQDYVNQCLTGGFPKTFISARTGVSHTVSNQAQCRSATSSRAASDYMYYIAIGGVPVKMAAKLKTSGCGGGVSPYVGRIQSVDGSFRDDYQAIP